MVTAKVTVSNRELYKMPTQSVIQIILIILNDRRQHSQTRSVSASDSGVWSLSGLPARLLNIHPMHTARACTIQSMK